MVFRQVRNSLLKNNTTLLKMKNVLIQYTRMYLSTTEEMSFTPAVCSFKIPKQPEVKFSLF